MTPQQAKLTGTVVQPGGVLHDQSQSGTEWAAWLRGAKWDYWATGAFVNECAPTTALRRVEEFMRECPDIRALAYATSIRAERLRPRAYCAVAIEQGVLMQHIHVHLLLGGLGAHPFVLPALVRAWRWGPLHIDRYRPDLDPPHEDAPRSGACAYLTKSPDCVHFIGKMKCWRPRND